MVMACRKLGGVYGLSRSERPQSGRRSRKDEDIILKNIRPKTSPVVHVSRETILLTTVTRRRRSFDISIL